MAGKRGRTSKCFNGLGFWINMRRRGGLSGASLVFLPGASSVGRVHELIKILEATHEGGDITSVLFESELSLWAVEFFEGRHILLEFGDIRVVIPGGEDKEGRIDVVLKALQFPIVGLVVIFDRFRESFKVRRQRYHLIEPHLD